MRLLLACAASLLVATAGAFPLGFLEQHRTLRISPRLSPTTTTSFNAIVDADHSYFRPDTEVSGFPKNNKKYHRSPCPAMNSLANHGYLPRDGKNITQGMIKQALIEVFNIDDGIAQTLVNALPETITLADLGVHNFIEHDASLVHDDLFFGQDPALVNSSLVNELLARATKDGFLTKRVIAHWRHDREAQCAKTNPQYDFGLKRQAGAYGEAALLVLAMGNYGREAISVAHAKSFLLEERIPDDFESSKVAITGTHIVYVAAKIKAMSTFPWALLSAY